MSDNGVDIQVGPKSYRVMFSLMMEVTKIIGKKAIYLILFFLCLLVNKLYPATGLLSVCVKILAVLTSQ